MIRSWSTSAGEGTALGCHSSRSERTRFQARHCATEAARLASGRGVRLMIVWNVGGFGGGGGDPQGAYGIVRGGGCPACETLGSAMGVR